MDEMTLLQQRYEAQPGPSPHTTAAARARLLGAATAAPARRRTGFGLSRVYARPLLAGGLGLALAAGLLATQVVGGDGKGPMPLSAEPASAQELLHQAADAAGKSTEQVPRPGQFIYVESIDKDYDNGLGDVNGPVTKPKWHTAYRQRWDSVDGSADGLMKGGPVPVLKLPRPTGAPAWPDMPYTQMAQLPRSPIALLALAHKAAAENKKGDETMNEATFAAIAELLTEKRVPPKLRAALFNTMAEIPAVTKVDDATDAYGRHGVAIALSTQIGTREEMIFDRHSYQPMSYREVVADATVYQRHASIMVSEGHTRRDHTPAGTVITQIATHRTAIVDKAGQLP